MADDDDEDQGDDAEEEALDALRGANRSYGIAEGGGKMGIINN